MWHIASTLQLAIWGAPLLWVSCSAPSELLFAPLRPSVALVERPSSFFPGAPADEASFARALAPRSVVRLSGSAVVQTVETPGQSAAVQQQKQTLLCLQCGICSGRLLSPFLCHVIHFSGRGYHAFLGAGIGRAECT